jgi:class 3 adenylate cyclase
MLSLRIVISLWMALALILIAAITLSITLTSSLTALRDMGSAHCSSLLDNANLEASNLFGASVTQLQMLRNYSASRNWTWPSDTPTVSAAWLAAIRTVFIGGQGRYTALVAYFGDGTTLIMNQSPGENTYQAVELLPPPTNLRATGLLNISSSLVNSKDHTVNTSTLTFAPAVLASTLISSVRAYPPGSDVLYYQPGFQAFLLNKKLLIMILNFATLPRLESQRALPTYGIAQTGITVNTLNSYLAAARSTPNTAAFAITNDGFIIGAALPDASDLPFNMHPKTNYSIPGCANVTNYDNSSMPAQIGCLVPRSQFSYAPLRELPNELANTTVDQVRELKLDGKQYFVAVAPVRSQIPGLGIRMILLMPEKDIIGDVVKSQNIAIGVSAAVVVVMAAASFAFIVAMLRPLDDVAERMLRAATFEPETEPLSMSAMQEVRDLQTAYKQMSAELNRIRSFVPQSVLHGGGGGDDAFSSDNDGEGSLEFDSSQPHVQEVHSASHTPRDGSSSARQRPSTFRQQRSTPKGYTASETPTAQDLQSSRSHRSDRSMRSRIASSSGGSVALDCSVRMQAVSVVVANCNGFYSATRGMSRDEIVASMASMVDRVMGEVKTKGGVLAFFHGDHFAATFNAVKPSPAHARNAAAVALALTAPTAGPRTSQGQLTLRAGVSTGKCLVGNVGSAEAKNFSVMGPAFTQALVLERLTRLYTTGEGAAVAALASRRTCEDIATNYLYEYVDLVQLPGSAQATLVGRLVGPKANGAANQHDTEWLYVVGAAKSNDPYAGSNAAMVEASSSKLKDVAAFLDTVRADPKVTIAPSVLRLLESCVNAGLTVPSSLGQYYADAIVNQSGDFDAIDPTIPMFKSVS